MLFYPAKVIISARKHIHKYTQLGAYDSPPDIAFASTQLHIIESHARSSEVMAPQLDSMPTEVLTNILQRVRNSSAKNGLKDFVALQTTCHLFRNSAQPILWADVILDNESLALFLKEENATKYCLIRSLTVSINSLATRAELQRMQRSCGGSGIPEELERWRPVFTTKVVWKCLQTLAAALPAMSHLISFSFCVQESKIKGSDTGLWLQHGAIKGLIENLPETCTGIEIDTASLKQLDCKKVHLCDTIREVLPRMKHVRLRLGQLCESIFISDPTKSRTQTVNRQSPTDFSWVTSLGPRDTETMYEATACVHATLLETLIIRFTKAPSMQQSYLGWSRCKTLYTPKKGLFKGYSFDPSSYATPFIVDAFISALKAQAFPTATKLSVLANAQAWGRKRMQGPHVGPGIGPYYLENSVRDYNLWKVCELDVLKDRFVMMPYFLAEGFLEPDFLRIPIHGDTRTKGYFGDWNALKSKSEGGAWETTVAGSRLPGGKARADTEDKGHVFVDGAVAMLDGSKEMLEMIEHLCRDIEGVQYVTNGVAQMIRDRLAMTLKYVVVEDRTTREKRSLAQNLARGKRQLINLHRFASFIA